MSLTTGRSAFRNFLLSQANNQNEDQTKEQAVDTFLDALEAYIKSASIIVPAAGLVAPNGPVTGQADGTLE